MDFKVWIKREIAKATENLTLEKAALKELKKEKKLLDKEEADSSHIDIRKKESRIEGLKDGLENLKKLQRVELVRLQTGKVIALSTLKAFNKKVSARMWITEITQHPDGLKMTYTDGSLKGELKITGFGVDIAIPDHVELPEYSGGRGAGMLDLLLKHAKHFTNGADDEGAPLSKVVHFLEGGSLLMTNGIVLLFALNIHALPAGTATPDGEESDADPIALNTIMNLIRRADEVEASSLIRANVDVEGLLSFVQTVIHASRCDSEDEKKKDPVLNINLKKEEGLIYEQHGTDLKSFYIDRELSPMQDEIGASLNAKNLEKVLNVFRDLGHDDVQLLITGRFRPIEIRTYDCAIRTVVMPVRTY